MAEPQQQQQQQQRSSDSPPQLKLPTFVVNLFPFLKPKPPASVNGADGGPKPTGGGDKETQNSTVSFPYNPPKSTEPLKLEAEPSSGSTSNSLVIWQVYALGGFLVLKWAWARWNERNETSDKKDDDEDDDQAPQREDD
ncbi:hypothetical protein N665_0237s0010 [Sinapis alba]|nr:hypothetical protein N665_0237s0010 [Sinapis alba]